MTCRSSTQETKQKIVPLLFNYFSSNKIEFMDLDNMERIDWKKPKWDRVTTQRQKRNLAKLLSNQTSRVLLVYLVFFVFTLVEKSSQSVNRSDVAKSKSFQFSPISSLDTSRNGKKKPWRNLCLVFVEKPTKATPTAKKVKVKTLKFCRLGSERKRVVKL